MTGVGLAEDQMLPLTPEQKEYYELKDAMNGMSRTFLRLQDEGKIPQCCIPRGKNPNGPCKFIVESIFYGYMDQLIFEHTARKDGKIVYRNEEGELVTEELKK